MHIRKNDTVKILSGDDRGKTGKVLSVNPEKLTATVQGVNVIKKNRRPKKEGEKGEVIQVIRPVSASRLMIVCSACGKPSRTGMRIDEKSQIKVRYCKQCNASL